MIPWCYFTSPSSHPQHSAFSSVHTIYLYYCCQQSIPFNSICHSMKIKFLSPTDSFFPFLSAFNSSQWLHAVFDAVCWMWMYLLYWNFFHFFLSSFPLALAEAFFFVYSRLRLTIDFWHAHKFFHGRDVYFLDYNTLRDLLKWIGMKFYRKKFLEILRFYKSFQKY